jgi:hypothetical protein
MLNQRQKVMVVMAISRKSDEVVSFLHEYFRFTNMKTMIVPGAAFCFVSECYLSQCPIAFRLLKTILHDEYDNTGLLFSDPILCETSLEQRDVFIHQLNQELWEDIRAEAKYLAEHLTKEKTVWPFQHVSTRANEPFKMVRHSEEAKDPKWAFIPDLEDFYSELFKEGLNESEIELVKAVFKKNDGSSRYLHAISDSAMKEYGIQRENFLKATTHMGACFNWI